MDNENQQNKKNQVPSTIHRPAFSIKKALDFAHKVYDENSLNAFDNGILSKILGSTSTISSTFTKNKAALTHYGLIEKITIGNNEGLLKITDTFFQYVTELDQIKKQELLYSFLYSPTIFKFIKEIMPDLTNINKDVIVMQIIRNKKIEKDVAEEITNTFITSYEYIKSLESISSPHSLVKIATSIEEEIPSQEDKVIENEQPLKKINDSTVHEEIQEPNKFSKGINWNLSNNKSFSIKLPDNLRDLSKEDLMEILDVIEVVTKKVNRQLDLKSD